MNDNIDICIMSDAKNDVGSFLSNVKQRSIMKQNWIRIEIKSEQCVY